MKRISLLLNSLALLSLLTIVSCGSDNQLSTSSSGNSKSALGQQCSCTSEFSPVCDTNNSVSYENICLAKCYGVTTTVPAHCSPDATLWVCARNKNTYGLHTLDEDTAVYSTEFGRNSIVKFSKCN